MHALKKNCLRIWPKVCPEIFISIGLVVSEITIDIFLFEIFHCLSQKTQKLYFTKSGLYAAQNEGTEVNCRALQKLVFFCNLCILGCLTYNLAYIT